VELLVAAGYAPAADTPLRSDDAAWLRATMSACAFVRQHLEFQYVVDLQKRIAAPSDACFFISALLPHRWPRPSYLPCRDYLT
jgi:hypothetical protein